MDIDAHIPHDGYQLHYRLEGCVNEASPVLVFSNGVNCDIRMWDATIPLLKKRFPDFRFLRYGTVDTGLDVHQDRSTDLGCYRHSRIPC